MRRTQIRSLAGAAVMLVAVAGCGKTVELGSPSDGRPAPSEGPGPGPDTGQNVTPTPIECGPGQTARWRFAQPDPVTSRVVDLLFVADTSASMDTERARIADTIPAFIERLAPGTDYRIAVMLGHGGASPHSGRLYSNPGKPAVLGPGTGSVADIQKALRGNLIGLADDSDEANGEALLYSLLRSLEPNRKAAIQAKGFYRPEAALSVVLVTDENDLCYQPDLNGYTVFPDFVPSALGHEKAAYDRYCKRSGMAPSGYPSLVYSKLHELKGKAPVTLAGIVHSDPKRVPQGPGSEDAIGHGPIELARMSANGVIVDIAERSYASGLTELADVVQSTLVLETRFVLDGPNPILAETVRVAVDGQLVAAVYDPGSRSVEIAVADAGGGRSIVEVAACLNSARQEGNAEAL